MTDERLNKIGLWTNEFCNQTGLGYLVAHKIVTNLLKFEKSQATQTVYQPFVANFNIPIKKLNIIIQAFIRHNLTNYDANLRHFKFKNRKKRVIVPSYTVREDAMEKTLRQLYAKDKELYHYLQVKESNKMLSWGIRILRERVQNEKILSECNGEDDTLSSQIAC